ncbi:HDIG domain-containing protein [Carboxydocella thermautotrophica]|nr:HDIG domain-containing protein [Carboxydocella thermautotrophica]
MEVKFLTQIGTGSSATQVREVLLAAVKAIVQAVGERDRYTRHHSQNVAEYAKIIARELDLPSEQVESIYLAALFHDIGKIGVPDQVLNKPGKLEENELLLIREHPLIAGRILESFGEFRDILPAITQHHEHWDGSGYPFGLIGEAIDLGARIIAVADAFDAMTSDRIYRPGMPQAQAIDILSKGAGQQWDSRVVNAFINWWEKTYNPRGRHDWQMKHIQTIYQNFLKDTTGGKVLLLDEKEIEQFLKPLQCFAELPIENGLHLSWSRQLFSDWLGELGLDQVYQQTYQLVFSELVSNMLKHAEKGTIQWGRNSAGEIVLIANDQGQGFVLEKLPQSIMVSGFSTKKSLGWGLPFILEHCRQLVIAKTESGTFIAIKLGCEQIEDMGQTI